MVIDKNIVEFSSVCWGTGPRSRGFLVEVPEHCQVTLEQGPKPTNAHIAPCNELAGVYTTFTHMCALPVTPKRLRRWKKVTLI